jgi:hypothetical protein
VVYVTEPEVQEVATMKTGGLLHTREYKRLLLMEDNKYACKSKLNAYPEN